MIFELTNKEEFKTLNLESWRLNCEYFINNNYIHSGVKEFLVQKIEQCISQTSTNKTHPRVIDIGCGTGWLAGALKDKPIDYVGIDIMSEFVNSNSIKYPDFGQFIPADIEQKVPSGIKQGDIIVCAFSLIEMPYLEKALSNLNDLMYAGSRLLIMGLNPFFEIFRDTNDKLELEQGIKMFRGTSNQLVISKKIKREDSISPANYYRILYDIDDYIHKAEGLSWSIYEAFEEVNKVTKTVDQPIYNYISFIKN